MNKNGKMKRKTKPVESNETKKLQTWNKVTLRDCVVCRAFIVLA